MQSSGLMTWSSLRSPVIASVGQRRMQAVQPVQFSVMMKGIGVGPFDVEMQTQASSARKELPLRQLYVGGVGGSSSRGAKLLRDAGRSFAGSSSAGRHWVEWVGPGAPRDRLALLLDHAV